MKIAALLLLVVSLVYAEDALQELQKGNLEFSASLYQELIKTNPGNVIFSPLSVQIVLALTQLGAKGETASELTKGLHLPSTPEKTKEAFKALLPELKGNEFYSLDAANKAYIKEGFPINPDFQKLSKEVFDAELENIDFTNTIQASQKINEWVESKTNKKIKDLILPDMITSLTRLVLINALYFKGNWSSPFDAYGTSKRKFFKTEKDEIEVDTMHQIETFHYAENDKLDAKFLVIPYEAGDVSFTIVLPNKKEGLSALETQLKDVFLPQNYSYERVSLFMPKFKIESTFKLIPPLKALGIKKAFDGDEADFSGLLANNERLVISEVIQKAFINVTETGTEAAAATAVIVGVPLSAPIFVADPIIFDANRPFFYFLTHKKTKQIIFFGRISSL